MSAIVWPRTEGTVPPADFEERLCVRLQGRVDRAYLFGSFGTEAFRVGSDIDLILVCDTGLPFVERARQFTDLYALYPRLDILVYTAAELEAQLKETVGFWASVKTNLRELPLG
jgi:predicted nucleotidyltransferase